MGSSHLAYCNSLFYHTKRQILVDFKEFKTLYLTVFANLAMSVCATSTMSHLSYTNFTGSHSLLYTVQIQPHYLQSNIFLSAVIKHSALTRCNHLSVSSTRLKHMWVHSFAVAALTEWNKLPQAVRTWDSINGFRKQLKTYLPCPPHSPSPAIGGSGHGLSSVFISLVLYKCFILQLLHCLAEQH